MDELALPPVETPSPDGLMSLTPAQMDDMARSICQEIDASEIAKGTLPERWERNEKIYNVDPDVTNLHIAEGMQPYNIPLYRQKADRVVGTIHSSITGIYPYVQCLDEVKDGDNDEAVERALHAMAEAANFDSVFKQSLKLAVNTNIGTIRVRPLAKSRSKTKAVGMEWIHPGNMMCYPAEAGTFEDAKTVGHRLYKMRYRIEQDQKAKIYYPMDIFGGDDPNEHYTGHPGRKTQTTESVNQADQEVELWEVVTEYDLKGDGDYQLFLCTVAKQQTKLLSCQPYPYSRPWYFDVRLDEDGQVWPGGSLAQIMQGVQLAYSDIHTTLIHGSYMAAFPVIVVSGGVLPVKAKKYGPSTLIESPVDMKVQAVTTGFNPGALPMEGNKLEEVADAVTGISRLGTSENLPSGTTATAAAALTQAENDRKDQYTESVAPSVSRIWEFLFEILQAHFAEIQQILGSRFPSDLSQQQVMGQSYRFEVTGKGGSSSPQVLLQKLQMLFGMANNPNSALDASKIEAKIIQALDLPFSAQGLAKPPPVVDPQQIMQLLQGVQNGQVQPMQAAQAILQEIHDAQTSAGQGSGAIQQPGMAGSGNPLPPFPSPESAGPAFNAPPLSG